MPTDLDLTVEAAKEFERAVVAKSPSIAGHVQTPRGQTCDAAIDETRGRRLRSVDVAEREPRTADADLAGFARCRQLEVRTQHAHLEARRISGRLGRSVAVQKPLRRPAAQYFRERTGLGSFPAE